MSPPERQIRRAGSWPSPLTPELVVAAAVGLSQVSVALDPGEPGRLPALVWAEQRPSEGGRSQLVRRDPDGKLTDLLPAGFSARTRVHEYGGGAWWLHADDVYFANWDDQRLYRLPPDGAPVPLTRPPSAPAALRYADGRVTPEGSWVICVRESHEGDGEAVNELVAVPTTGGETIALGTAADFVACPRVSPDGRWLAWVQWDHPQMPWDGTELWVAGLDRSAGDLELLDPQRVAGGPAEAITEPTWSPHAVLHFISDRSGWWNLHRAESPGRPAADDSGRVLEALDAEVGGPAWVFGTSRYAFLGTDVDGPIVHVATSGGLDHLRLLDVAGGRSTRLDIGFTAISSLAASGGDVVGIGASFDREPVVFALEDLRPGRPPAAPTILRPGRDLGLGPGWISTGRPITFPTSGGVQAHALYYPPTNPAWEAPAGERPPLLVAIHGGPTSAARPQLQLAVQFWTSRGFAVADVNYRGSTGFGRAYRELLDGQWGVADVEDCRAVADWLARQGEVDPDRQAIHGGSAGGLTTLNALLDDSPFDAGTSSYGVTDLETLSSDTHKFESRYNDRLVGPLAEARDRYRERSPIHQVDRLRRPVLILQGLEDEVVPPAQAEALVAALDRNRVPHAYLAFEGEQHGFRQAETIRRALDAELVFYARVLGFDPPDGAEPLVIEHLDSGG